MRDALTGLASAELARATLAQWQAPREIEGATIDIHSCCRVMLLGLGRIDTVNLAYGASAGDRALLEVAQRILEFAEEEFESETWLAARLSGGNFLIAVRESCSPERWQWLAEALADFVSHPISDDANASTLRLWPRIAVMRPAALESPDVILDRLADTLARAQDRHGSRVLWVDGKLFPQGRSSASLEADLLGALDRDEIKIVYQPQFSLEDDSLIGAEALARWDHPELGHLGANALFAIAERADHVAQLSQHIARVALADAAIWPDHLRLSLNVTPADLSSGMFATSLPDIIGQAGFDPQLLTLEITEHVLLADLERAAISFSALRAHGMRVALDDFGAGFCNFRYLKLLPLDYLKLDRTMVEGLGHDTRDLAIFRGIVTMAKALDLAVIVEGVERSDQISIAREEGAAIYQGFIGAKPLDRDAFLTFAADYPSR
ncbi:EAL domain-containing protein [Altererythrobacter sp. SALINAS58]|uniref:GGDEF domain-containing phosphodiesterase n=1 Tax=Alteripontixanthobacter muriae TaxID=2705546 RepID=UPI001575760C|nr:GGDEF domain-containing phosphodiesterase [Alteripontixanthobacter muriae]NTZ42095.1 EAL domain-containing protein [Alteripontixanthobacter muriae]